MCGVLTSDSFVVMLCFPNTWKVVFVLKIPSDFMDLVENWVKIGVFRIETFICIVATSWMCPCTCTRTHECVTILWVTIKEMVHQEMTIRKYAFQENNQGWKLLSWTIWFYKPFDCVWYRSNKDICHLFLDWIFLKLM